jgi:hypothetical protein
MALGTGSRLVDTAEGAPPWIGLILTPWLAGPWLAGAWVARRDASLVWGATGGLVLLSTTVATYLAFAGADAPELLPGLPLLAVAAGLSYGAAGAEIHHGEGGRFLAAVVLGATFVVEGVLLQQAAAESPAARGLFVVEAVAGALLATWIGGLRAGLIVVLVGAVVVAIELALLATIGPGLP